MLLGHVDLPAPFVPPEVDLRGLDFAPLQVHRLMDSDLFALSNGNEFKAACALWCKSWSQVPAGSLPNNDQILCFLACCRDLRAWQKVKLMAMRGWVLCADGRFYHALIAQNALAAWARRTNFRQVRESKDSRQARWRARCAALHALLTARGLRIGKGAGMGALVRLASEHIPGFDAERWQADESPPPAAPAAPAAPAPAPFAAPAAPTPPPSRAGQVCALMRAAGMKDVSPGDPRFLALLEQGATDAEFQGLAAEAVKGLKGWAWVLTVLPARRNDAARIRLAPPEPAPVADALAWTRNRPDVIVRGINLGIAPWAAIAAANGRGPSWDQYLEIVIEADAKQHAQAA
jgi:hypothetical protein